MRNIWIMVMAGGKGERFWPKSTASMPKHMLSFIRKKPMIRQTLERVYSLAPKGRIVIVTNKAQYKNLRQNAKEVPALNLITEPMAKNTAAAIGLAAIQIKKSDPEAVMAVLPSDHTIDNEKKFSKLLKQAARFAGRTGLLVTLGIKPRCAFTGYGYIKKGARLGNKTYKVGKFVEKPTQKKAQEYLKSGMYYWNSGIFIWKASAILDEIKKYMPQLSKALARIERSLGSASFEKTLLREYKKLKGVSIDYGVMEKTKKAVMLEAGIKWDDIGSWDSVSSYGKKDADNNIVFGDYKGMDTKGCIIVGDKGRLIATIGIKDVVIAQSADAILVCAKDRTQDVKTLVHGLKADKRLSRYTK